jgi:tripartite-type tricarboxylate transporter receptor subunit TctC
MEHLSQLATVKMLHVPFAGDAPALTAVLSGDVNIALVAVASATPFLSGGKLKGIAAGGPKRLKILPNLATIAEQTGFKDYSAYAWSVLVSAKGTPPDIIEKLNKATNEAEARPDVTGKLENLGLKTMPGDMKWAQEFVAQEIAKNKRIIESTGIKRE